MTPDTRVVAITGASAGIGRATALRLARDRASVAICARTDARLQPVAAAIEQAGGRALPVVADVTCQADMQELVARTVAAFGRLDVMVCNAGFGIAGVIDEIEPDQMRRLFDVNVFGTCNALRAALPVFRRQGHGHVVIVSSIVGRRGVPYMGAYAATKFAQVGIAEALRAEFVGSDIHVTMVFPVSTTSEFFEVMQRETGAPVSRAEGPTQTAEQVGDAIAAAIARPVAEVYPYATSRALVWLNAMAPRLCDRIVRKFGRRPLRPDADRR